MVQLDSENLRRRKIRLSEEKFSFPTKKEGACV